MTREVPLVEPRAVTIATIASRLAAACCNHPTNPWPFDHITTHADKFVVTAELLLHRSELRNG